MKPATTALTPIGAVTAVFDASPSEILSKLESAFLALSWLDALFGEINEVYQRDDGEEGALRISLLSEAGQFIAARAFADAHDAHAELSINLDAAKAIEGSAS